jgi:hypothetical protein
VVQTHGRGELKREIADGRLDPHPPEAGQQPHIYKKQKARRGGEEERAAKRREKDERTERRAAIWVD